MFLGTHTGDQPWDMRTTLDAITDGASNTLLIAENTLVGYSQGSPYAGGLETNWACPLPNFAMFLGSDDVCRSDRSPSDCLGGQLRRGKDGRDGPGWARANQRGTFEEINYGQNLTVEGLVPLRQQRPSPAAANFVFCDGAVRFLSSTIDGTVYAKIITPAGSAAPELLEARDRHPGRLRPMRGRRPRRHATFWSGRMNAEGRDHDSILSGPWSGGRGAVLPPPARGEGELLPAGGRRIR